MMPNLWPVWLDGGAWVVLGTLAGESAPGFETAEVWTAKGGRFGAMLPLGVGVPPEYMGWTGKELIVHGETDAASTCVATVKSVRLAGVIDTMEGFEPVAPVAATGAAGQQDDSLATQIARMTGHRMVLGELSLSGDCSIFSAADARGEITWARPAGSAFIPLITPNYLPSDAAGPDAETIKRATAAFRKLPLWNTVQTDWLETDEAKTAPLWDEGVGISVVTAHAAGRDWVYLSASGTCIFSGSAWAIWEVRPSGKWKLHSNPARPTATPSLYRVADLDGDGLIELISADGIVRGTRGVWTTILDTHVDWIGCAC